ncbi:sporulation protein YpjB [Lederbergia wuyishanensis]|uniref:Sporulation protein YpjB n=1 Tax=Lederbergia wuyishanensis TaxID=1347903 RepID=A0ABU0D0W8_9BACI|nr:sporulation protein YpjB [Lederbergia wuyishanensis]MCJ8006664.1 sporulation protein YpjB [Lederbergia wuyishanensis]MDQ0342046.1 sporulation protein YpjB [Lederbergia wuyishanensis]
MRGKSIILLLLCIFFSGFSVQAESKSSMTELDQLADEALKLTRFGRLEEAKNIMERFAELFSEKGVTERQFTMDELRIVTAAHHDALKALTSSDINTNERVKKVTAFRLASDAIISEYQPLWSQMERPIMNAFADVKNAALEGDENLYNSHLNEFLSTYSVIQPSIKIDIPIGKVQMLDSKIAYIDQYRSTFSEQKWMKELEGLETDLKNLFTDINKDDTDPSIWWVMFMTGGIIVSTLSYVSWRKYRGQKLQQQKRKDLND